MKHIQLITAIILFTSASAQNKEGSTVNIGLVYPISTNGLKAKECSNFLSLNAIAGISRSETGTSIAGISNIILDNAAGVQIAGFSNHIGNHAQGVQIAGMLNTIRSSASGTQIAGFMNRSGNANVQVAGFLNIAKKVKGVQIAGFMNIADSSDWPIGIINIVKNGEKSIGLSIDETRTVLLTFRSGGRVLYGIIGVGYNDRTHALQSVQAKDGTLKIATGEVGIGAHLNFTENFRVNTEIAAITGTDFEHGDYQRDVFRLLPSLRLQHLEFFAGPTFNYVSSYRGIGSDLITHYAWSKNVGAKNFQGIYFGAIGGLTYRF